MNLVFEPRNRCHGGQLVRKLLCFGVITVIAGTLAACGPSRPAATPSTPSSPVAPSTSPSVLPSGAGAATAIDAYRGMWKAYGEALRIPDPTYPDLSKYAQGDALKVIVDGLTRTKSDGLVGKGDIAIAPNVTGAQPNADPPTVTIKDCMDTSKSHLVKIDGSSYQDTPGGKRSVTATVSRQPDGTWKVSGFAVLAVGTC